MNDDPEVARWELALSNLEFILNDWGTKLDIPHTKEEAQSFLHWLIHDLKVCLDQENEWDLSLYLNKKGEQRFTTYESYAVRGILECCRLIWGDIELVGLKNELHNMILFELNSAVNSAVTLEFFHPILPIQKIYMERYYNNDL